MLNGFLLLVKEFAEVFIGFIFILIALQHSYEFKGVPIHFNGLPMIPLSLGLQEIRIGVLLI